jgi:hypothetical protein
MNIYWSIYSIPELVDLPKEKRKEIWHECRGKVFHHWQTWFLLLMQVVLIVVAIELVRSYFGSFNAVGLIVLIIISGLIAGVIAHFRIYINRSDIREYLKSYGQNIKPSL